MSRDWYIRTDKRNIQQTFGDIDAAAPTLKEKWRKNCKKYILLMIEGAVLVALLILALPVMFPKDTADYTVTLATETAVSSKAQETLCAALAACGTDRNGDGEVQIQLRALTVDTAADGERNTALEQLITSLTTDEYTLLAMVPAVYTRYVQAYTADGTSLFEPLSAAADGLWAQTETDTLPMLLWGVRALPNADGDAKDAQQAHLKLLEAYLQ